MRGVHYDAGKTTRDILDARKVINVLGIGEGTVFIDAGCGDGFISIEASKVVGDDGMIYAIDIYEKCIEVLKKTIKKRGICNIKPILGDITKKLQIKSGTVDIYFMANVFHGLKANNQIGEVMKEIKRLLKPDGILAIVDFKKRGTIGPHISLRLGADEVSDIIKGYGFFTKRIENVGPYHYIVIAGR